MANLLTNSVKHEVLPQLSDSDLTSILDNSNQQNYQINDVINLDNFNLDFLDELNDNLDQFIQTLELNQNQSIDNQFNQHHQEQINNDNYSNQFYPEQLDKFNSIDENFLNQQTSLSHLSSYQSNESNQTYLTSFDNQQYVNSIEFNGLNELSPNHSLYLNDNQQVEYMNSVNIEDESYENGNSFYNFVANSNEIINSPITDYYSNGIQSIQSVSSSIDYSIQSVNSFYSNNYSCSLTSSPSSISYAESTESFETADYSNNSDYLNNSIYSNYSNSYDQFSSQSFQSTNDSLLQSKSIESNQLNTKTRNQNEKPKRKRPKKVVSEEEIKRKLEIKLERKRKRLERKKIQNKEAARRYRCKKKIEEDEIDNRLMNVQIKYNNLRKQLKESLNEKRVLLKLVKDFADQSNNFMLPDWMKSDFSTSLL